MFTKPLVFAFLLLGLFLFGAPKASAQYASQGNGGFVVAANKLDKVEFYKARRQFQITDERPIVADYRVAPQGPNNLIINMQPMHAVPGQTVAYNAPMAAGNGGCMAGNALPNAGFARYAPATRQNSPAGLPAGNSTNLLNNKRYMPQFAAPVRAAKPAQPKTAPTVRQTAPVIAMYKQNSMPSFSQQAQTSASGFVSGRLMTKLKQQQ